MRSWQSYLMNGISRLVFKRQDVRSKSVAELREMFDKALDSVKADGTTKALSEKWFGFDVTVY